MNPHPANLELNYIVPVVAADGNGVFINDANDIPTLTFFQVRKQAGNQVFADVVASVRMNSLDELEQFQKSIENTIKEHRSKEK